MYCSLLLWDWCMLLENECRHRGYDCSLVLRLISCPLHWSQLNACIFCAICSLKCLMKLCQARVKMCHWYLSAPFWTCKPSERMVYTASVYAEKNTSLSSFCMCIIFCHNSSIISSAVLCWPVLLAFLLDGTGKSLFATSTKHWQKSKQEIYGNLHVVSVLKNLGVQWPV